MRNGDRWRADGRARGTWIAVLFGVSLVVNGVFFADLYRRRSADRATAPDVRIESIERQDADPPRPRPQPRGETGRLQDSDGRTSPAPGSRTERPARSRRPRSDSAPDRSAGQPPYDPYVEGSGGEPGAWPSDPAARSAPDGGGAAPSTSPAAPIVRSGSDVRRSVPDATAIGSSPLAARSTESDSEEEEDSAGSSEETDIDPNSDDTPPILESLAFDPPEVTDGSASTLWIGVRDDLSGVKSGWGFVSSPSGAARLRFDFKTDADGAPLGAKIPIPSRAETGVWYVSDLFIVDRADNPLRGSFNAATVPAGGGLRVTSSESDSTPPEVLRVWVENQTPNGGERNPIRVEIEDDRSGVGTVRGAFQNSAKTALLWFDCRAPAGGAGPWEGEILIPANADCGEWKLWLLRVTDTAGNIGSFSMGTPQTDGVSFFVSGQDCDSSPPTLESLQVAPTVVANETGSEILLSAVVRDEGSGPVSLYGWVQGPSPANGQGPRIPFNCVRDPRNPDGPWIGKFLMPQFAARGTWRVSTVRVSDRALNYRDYWATDPVLAGVTIEVE